ncbi:MAG: Iron complex transport system substrate-binding protein [Frondihabitans sp.]|nr:Iron complex transport system substrate-binding protein [Frondihabitans sp.]
MKLITPVLAGIAAALLVLTGCSAGANSSGNKASDTASSSSSAFPVTVDTKFGDVTIPKKPERVVALGWGDAETALALGVQPVGASDWLGFGGEGVGPWAKGLYTKAPKIIGTLEPSYEAIAALHPDLILDTKSSGDKARYEKLTAIAPTVDVPKGGDNYLTSFTQQMTMISTALGKKATGQKLIAQVNDQVTAVAKAHPGWKGVTVTAATKTSEGWGAYITGSERVDQLTKLGFVQNPKIAALKANSTGFSVSISEENLDLIDSDVIVAFPIFIKESAITQDPAWKNLTAVTKDHAVVIDGDLAAAYSLGTSLSREYALKHLVPLLEKATK